MEMTSKEAAETLKGIANGVDMKDVDIDVVLCKISEKMSTKEIQLALGKFDACNNISIIATTYSQESLFVPEIVCQAFHLVSLLCVCINVEVDEAYEGVRAHKCKFYQAKEHNCVLFLRNGCSKGTVYTDCAPFYPSSLSIYEIFLPN
jgi:hypothetical protein